MLGAVIFYSFGISVALKIAHLPVYNRDNNYSSEKGEFIFELYYKIVGIFLDITVIDVPLVIALSLVLYFFKFKFNITSLIIFSIGLFFTFFNPFLTWFFD